MHRTGHHHGYHHTIDRSTTKCDNRITRLEHESRKVSLDIECFRRGDQPWWKSGIEGRAFRVLPLCVTAAHDDNASRVSLEINSINVYVVVKL